VAMKWMQGIGFALAAGAALVVTGSGDVARQGHAPVQLVIQTLEGASGAEPDDFSGTMHSDVLTLVEREVNGQSQRVPTLFNDLGRVTLSLVMKDPGLTTPSAPSALNQVTITRYRVTYRRTDGRNTPGVDVPYPFDSGVTFTVPSEGIVTGGFQIVRFTAKQEAPLATLANNPDIIATIAEVTFYGADQAGNEVSATGRIGIDFGNFADPE